MSGSEPADTAPLQAKVTDADVAAAVTEAAKNAGDASALGGNGASALATSGNGASHPAPAATGEVEVECPGCGMVLVGDSPRPTAAWFCPRCDYPVFWASPPPPTPEGQKRARRRLPGTSGREVLGAGPCWNCGEMNDPDITSCLRCAATLPKPVAPEPEPITITVEVERPVAVPYVAPSATWPFVAAGILAGASVAIAGTLWILRAAGLLLVGATFGGS